MGASSFRERVRSLLRNPRLRWAHDTQLWVEVFATSNLGVLAADIYVAHSVNQFHKSAEYIPLWFSIIGTAVLALCIALKWVFRFDAPWRDVGYLVGGLAILTGLAGVLYHLESRFFLDRTIKSLTYAAPFAAPLAYTGLGFLLLMNRMIRAGSTEWARWIVFLALGRLSRSVELPEFDLGAFLSFADLPAVFLSLPVGQPPRVVEASSRAHRH